MLISLGHGDRIAWVAAPAADRDSDPTLELTAAANDGATADPDTVPAAVALPELLDTSGDAGFDPTADVTAAPAADPESREAFGYLFADAGALPDTDKAAHLDALAAAMAETQGDDATGNARLAPVMTYFGQFIDHDITANTNSDAVTAALRIGVTAIKPAARSLVVTGLKNLRKGSLGLDSLYGDGPIPGPTTQKLKAALRNGIRMRVGHCTPLPGSGRPVDRPAIPALAGDGRAMADLPRVGSLVGPGKPFATTADLPEALRPSGGTDFWERRAFIGDSRNDENLIVAQLHMAFLRFHNAVVDWLGAGATFEKARGLVTWHYQWLIVNEYLPAMCDAPTLAAVVAAEAPLYKRFLDARAATLDPGSLPLPLEFSVAAFRFGHSMVRAEYDFNQNFMPTGGPRATFDQLFAFTGNDKTGPIGGSQFNFPTLPHNWIIDWTRFTNPMGPAGRRARKIDTHLTPPLFDMANEPGGFNKLFQRLAARNLRRGHVLNLPTAQALIASMTGAGFAPSQVLTKAQLVSGATGAAVTAGGFDTATPLWFYVLKEAEELADGQHLGPLGSRIVAETLVGLIVNDRDSYWNKPGGKWHPSAGAKPKGQTIDTIAELLHAAGVM